jgi:hypothetical protein
MLIRRDRLLSKLHGLNASNTSSAEDGSTAQPSDATCPGVDEDESATQKQFLDRRITELLASAMGKKPELDEWTVRTLLQLPP